MNWFCRKTLGIAGLLLGALALSTPAGADGGVRAGTLTCNVSSGWGFVIGSSRDLRCTFSPVKTPAEHYNGSVTKFGVDIGFVSSAVIVWAVVAPTGTIAPGSLAGDYGGATASATIAVGLGANVLIGGSNNTIALQPLSIEGNTGLNVAAGIAAITLQFQP
ncbi:MAG TPA: DUF992 domain-containing protein [Stellaceae bacterium]|nr:DUF992 domain-containing protein [Stellaceae bacterium]HYC15446.1 DUF992 domain-containing protein [Stellaceae bacterium]